MKPAAVSTAPPPDPFADLVLERWPIDRAADYPGNPKQHDIDEIRASIRAAGVYKPITVQKSTGRILAGHGTREALRLEGARHVAVIVHDCTDAQARLIVAGDNGIPQLGGVDPVLLDKLLQPLGDELRGSGYTRDLLDNLLAKAQRPDEPEPAAAGPKRHRRQADPDTLPERPAARSRSGDLWLIGPHRLLVGDSFKPEDVARLLAGAKADLVVTDPPYAIYGSSTGVNSDIADDKMVRPFFEALLRVCEASVDWFDHVYVHTDWRSYSAVFDSAARTGLALKNCIVWDKGGQGMGSAYVNTHEFIAFMAKLPPHGSMGSGRKAGQRLVYASNIMRHNRPTGDDRHHNAAKPVALLAELITNSSDTGERVLDLFCGSGSTLAACHQTDRLGYGMEISPRAADIAVARLEQLLGVDATTENNATQPPDQQPNDNTAPAASN